MRIQSNDRVLIVGKTGSGKTYLARHLLVGQARLVVLDTKGKMTAQEWGCEVVGFEGLRDRVKHDDSFRLIYRPSLSADELKQVPPLLLGEGDLILYIDEAFSLFTSGAGRSFQELWTRGREHGLGVWASTQRPTWISLFLISESEHYFVFHLTWPDDRVRMSLVLEMKTIPTLRGHSFLYAHIDTDERITVRKMVPEGVFSDLTKSGS